MPDLTTIPDFPAWSINYSFDHQNAVVRTRQRGFKQQDSYSHRQVTIAQAKRNLIGAQLPYFESFVRNQANDGQLAFKDRYKDGSGVQSGTVRIVDGFYRVASNGKVSSWTITCDLEIFR